MGRSERALWDEGVWQVATRLSLGERWTDVVSTLRGEIGAFVDRLHDEGSLKQRQRFRRECFRKAGKPQQEDHMGLRAVLKRVEEAKASLDETEDDFQNVIANTGINEFGVPRAMKDPSTEPRTWSARDLSAVVKWLVKTFGSSAGRYKLSTWNQRVAKQVMLLRRKVEAQRVGDDNENPLVQQLKNFEVMWQAYSSAIDKAER